MLYPTTLFASKSLPNFGILILVHGWMENENFSFTYPLLYATRVFKMFYQLMQRK